MSIAKLFPIVDNNNMATGNGLQPISPRPEERRYDLPEVDPEVIADTYEGLSGMLRAMSGELVYSLSNPITEHNSKAQRIGRAGLRTLIGAR